MGRWRQPLTEECLSFGGTYLQAVAFTLQGRELPVLLCHPKRKNLSYPTEGNFSSGSLSSARKKKVSAFIFLFSLDPEHPAVPARL